MKTFLIVSLLALSGCAATPSSIVQRPTSARPLGNQRCPCLNSAR